MLDAEVWARQESSHRKAVTVCKGWCLLSLQDDSGDDLPRGIYVLTLKGAQWCRERYSMRV